ncbi:uncharacterized protein VTP21DRAFT_10129 [Calcarisporiella thermophila]|uniref:uncharacterized protein n=1 Tax=Calcarisporiella thermophila TaxID=911321 RepID=UPI003743954A
MDNRTLFEKERDNLVNEIAQALEQVITSMSLLNRNLETVITIGKDFENVAALWKGLHSNLTENADLSLAEPGSQKD